MTLAALLGYNTKHTWHCLDYTISLLKWDGVQECEGYK